jgi:DNA repair exonuclease SbcCD ATPase subunit
MSDVFIDIGDEAKKQIEGLVTELLNAVDAVKQFNTEFKRVKVPSDAQKAIDKTTASIKTQNKAIDQAEKITKKLIATKEKERLAEIQLQKQRENAFDKFEKNIKKEEQLKEKAKQQAEKLAAQEVKASERKRLAELKLQADREKAFDRFENNLQKTERAREREIAASERAARAANKEKEKINELNRPYNQLAQALKQAEKEYRDLAASQGLNDKETQKALKKAVKLKNVFNSINEPIGRFSDNVGNYPKTLGGGIKAIASLGKAFIGVFGIVEGVKLIFNFAKESRELALQAKGVEFAFESIGEKGQKAFDSIKKSTRGALSDLTIQKAISEFENFNILTEDAGILFEFLSVRAAQTGKSVDSLRDSLVEGLSKQSKLRIDNLGISAAELNKELEQTPDFVKAVANIAKREVAQAGSILDDAANGQQRWNAALENTQVALGKLLLDIGDGGALGFLAKLLQRLSDGFNKVSEGLEIFRKGFDELNKQIPALGKSLNFISNVVLKSFGSGLEQIGSILRFIGGLFGGIGAAIDEVKKSFVDFINVIKQLKDIDFSSPVALIKSLGTNFKDVFDGIKKESGDVGKAFAKGFTDATKKVKKATKEIDDLTAAEKKRIQGLIDQIVALDKNQNAIKLQSKSVTELEAILKKLTDTENKLAADRAKRASDAQQELDLFKVDQQVQAAKKIAENEKETTKERLKALDELTERTKAFINIKRNGELDSAQNDPERELIERQRALDLIKLEEETAKISNDIQRDAINERKQIIVTGITEISNLVIKQREAELIANEEAFKQGLKSREQFEKDKNKIIARSAREQLEQQIAFLTAELLAFQKTTEEKIAIELQLAKVKSELRKVDLQEAKDKQDQDQENIDLEKQKLEQAIEILKGEFSKLGEAFGIPEEAFNTIFDGIRNGFESIGEATDAFGSAAIGVFEQITAADNARLDRRLENIQREAELQLAFEGNTAEAREAITAQLALKESEIRRKQAQNEKKNALFQIGVSTAQAIIKTAATLGFPAAIPFVAAVGAIGAAQAAIVASQPIPEFKEGVRGFKGGNAIVGDGGKREPITDSKGKLLGISPNRSTLVNLPKGANVYSSIKEYNHEKGLNNILQSNGINPMGGAIFNNKLPVVKIQNNGITEDQMYNAVKKAVGTQSTFNVNIDKKGVQTYLTNGGKRTTNFLNNRVSGKGKQV